MDLAGGSPTESRRKTCKTVLNQQTDTVMSFSQP